VRVRPPISGVSVVTVLCPPWDVPTDQSALGMTAQTSPEVYLAHAMW
jgi:hypothetical protein